MSKKPSIRQLPSKQEQLLYSKPVVIEQPKSEKSDYVVAGLEKMRQFIKTW